MSFPLQTTQDIQGERQEDGVEDKTVSQNSEQDPSLRAVRDHNNSLTWEDLYRNLYQGILPPELGRSNGWLDLFRMNNKLTMTTARPDQTNLVLPDTNVPKSRKDRETCSEISLPLAAWIQEIKAGLSCFTNLRDWWSNQCDDTVCNTFCYYWIWFDQTLIHPENTLNCPVAGDRSAGNTLGVAGHGLHC